MLTLRNLETFYGPLQALFGVSLEVPEGGIITILGANGSGKSTVLKTIAGLLKDQPEKGSIEFEGKPIQGLDTAKIVRLGISYVPEGREVFCELTVHENLQMGAYLRRDRKQIEKDTPCLGPPGGPGTGRDRLPGSLPGRSADSR